MKEGPIEDTEPLLENPIWNALTTKQAALALGTAEARRFPDNIGPLSGMRDENAASWAALEPQAGTGLLILFLQKPLRLPAGWTLLRGGPLVQMVADDPKPVATAPPAGVALRVLTADDAPAMVALAKLTEPGPFRLRTMELGTFFGIFDDERLLAMAGKRLHVPGYVEVSGVCTHPDARGRGYARLLMSCVMEEIIGAGETPFLHTFAGNHNAIRVYQDLGFTLRRSFELAVVQRGAGGTS